VKQADTQDVKHFIESVIKLKGGVTTTDTVKNSFFDSVNEEKKDDISEYLSIESLARFDIFDPKIDKIKKYLESFIPDYTISISLKSSSSAKSLKPILEGGEDNLDYFKTELKKTLAKQKEQYEKFEKLKGKRVHEKCLADTGKFILKNGTDKIVNQLHYEDEFREKFCTDILEDTGSKIKELDKIIYNLESNMTLELSKI